MSPFLIVALNLSFLDEEYGYIPQIAHLSFLKPETGYFSSIVMHSFFKKICTFSQKSNFTGYCNIRTFEIQRSDFKPKTAYFIIDFHENLIKIRT